MRTPLVAACCAAAALATGGLAVVASIVGHGWNPTALVRMGSGPPDERISRVARATDPDFVLVKEGRYDGVYYYAIARDPLALGDEHELIDRPSYRYGHAGYGQLAWLASGGHPAAVPVALLVLGLLALGVAGGATSLLFAEVGWTPWGALAVALDPGLLYAVSADTTETVGAALLAVALLAYTRGRLGLTAAALVPLCLVKEPFVLVPAALAVWELVRWSRSGRPPDLWARAFTLAAGPVALVAWFAYVKVQIGEWPVAAGAYGLSPPLAGWKTALLHAGSWGFDSSGGALTQVGQIAVPVLVATGAALAIGALRAVRLRTPLDAVYLPQVLLLIVLDELSLEYPKDLLRTAAIPLLLVPVVVCGARSSTRWPARGPGPST
jgi:hypothetical protein